MSLLQRKDLHAPLNSLAIQKLLGHLNELNSPQGAAATQSVANGIISLATNPTGGAVRIDPVMTTQNYYIYDIYAFVSKTAGAGESIVYDVQMQTPTLAFASVLTSTLTYNATSSPDTQIKFSFANGIFVPAGSIFSVARTYTVGGGPALGAGAQNQVVIELTP